MQKRGLFIAAVALGMLANVAPSRAQLADRDLLAGQDLDVGNVIVEDDGGTAVKVTVEIENPAPDGQDWCLQEVHIHVASSESEIPQNKKGNPKIGHFEVNETVDCSLMEMFSFDQDPNVPFVVAVHAVVDTQATCQANAILYGTRRIPSQGSVGQIYKIDVLNDIVTLVADFGDPAPGNENSPNGLGYDPVNDLLYFSATDSGPSDLYSVAPNEAAPGTVVINNLGMLEGESAGATFHMGNYWYVLNDGDDLQQVVFPFSDATNQTAFTGGVRALRFGDIVFKPNSTTLIGSTLSSATSNPVTPELFFELIGATYNELCNEDDDGVDAVGNCGAGLQIAFGSNGVLYGHNTGIPAWFEIDPATGLITDDSLPITSDFQFTDIASGELCESDNEETAWGDGLLFASTGPSGRRSGSWATYIEVSP